MKLDTNVPFDELEVGELSQGYIFEYSPLNSPFYPLQTTNESIPPPD